MYDTSVEVMTEAAVDVHRELDFLNEPSLSPLERTKMLSSGGSCLNEGTVSLHTQQSQQKQQARNQLTA
ncbi:hypothetical protein RRG08_002836 [Elysia crispata]|uniref:Uncharacterized protein n=1 Tax=Elysia crispata TaxID=231223 RepID=A0AAE0XV32_9GAST|nr:hypothetical protein RRG08_002836 [Elysia crispata]